MTIKLTEGQRDSLIDFIECNFYPNIQNDDSIDSIDYAIDLLNVYTRLRSAAKHRRSTGLMDILRPLTGLRLKANVNYQKIEGVIYEGNCRTEYRKSVSGAWG